jgi:hypothetical protein
MNRATILFLVGAGLVTAVALFLGRAKITKERAPLTEAQVPLPSATPGMVSSDTAKSDPQEGRAQTIFHGIKNANVPIHFWGKILDQNERPIQGVDVEYNYSTEHAGGTDTAWAQQNMHKGIARSDSAGMFVIEGIRGHTLSLERFVKSGYKDSTRRSRVYNYYGDTSAAKFSPNPASPVVFVMRGEAASEKLIKHGGTFGKTARVAGDGTPLRWDLSKDRPDPEGELQIVLMREPAVVARLGQTVLWSANVAIVGGGIVEAPSEEEFYEAPEQGYRPEVSYPKLEQKRGVSARSFYVRTRDGKYGRIELDLYADDEGPTARCLVKAVLNPSGSRSLE